MIAGHYAPALVANQGVSRSAIGYLLVASQLPDLLWLSMHALGLDPLPAGDGLANPVYVEMMISHDVLPTLAWIGVTVLAGRLLLGAWRPGWFGGALVLVHAIADGLSGYPHNVFGPHSAEVGIGLYNSAPRVAVAIEALFAAGFVAWAMRNDQVAGLRRATSTYVAWLAVFGGGIALTFLGAPALAESNPTDGMEAPMVVGLLATYVAQIAVLAWAEGRPTQPSSTG